MSDDIPIPKTAKPVAVPPTGADSADAGLPDRDPGGGGTTGGAPPGEAGAPARPAASSEPAGRGWETFEETRTPGLVRRILTTWRHLVGMAIGALVTSVRERPVYRRRGLRYRMEAIAAFFLRPFLRKDLRELPFPVQFRRRLEMMGPTYIKLGQILALRRDLLPAPVTRELSNLLDHLPVVPYERFLELVTERLGRPLPEIFSWVDPEPLGSASIAQIHRATTLDGDDVIIKMVKPGIPELLRRDAILLRVFSWFLALFFSRYRPRRVIREFVDYTLREVDLSREADNAETFAANFRDMPDVVFPKIYRHLSGRTVLTMAHLDGLKPSDPRVQELPEADKERLVDLGAGAVIRMLYRDGFFHADLHPGNLLVLPGPRCGFIDLGMVGRFDEGLRRALLYYFYCLVMGDSENAARYLAAVAETSPGADPHGFRREVQDISRRWQHAPSFDTFSLGQLILESVARAARYRMYFPVEMVLMVKALVTFEGVGQVLKPNLDVAQLSRTHVTNIFLHQFSPFRLAKETLTGGPEVIEALVKAPALITEGLKVLEQATRRPPENPFTGIRGTVLAGFCLLAAAMLAGNQQWLYAALMGAVGLLLALRPGR